MEEPLAKRPFNQYERNRIRQLLAYRFQHYKHREQREIIERFMANIDTVTIGLSLGVTLLGMILADYQAKWCGKYQLHSIS